MGTKVHTKSYFPGYHSMRDLNDDSNSFNWPLYHGDKTLSNGNHYNGFLPGVADGYTGYDRNAVKRTMLEHEAIFKNQVYELHRVYRIQRDLMNEIKRKEVQQNRFPLVTSISSSPLASQVTSEDARKWNIPGFPVSARPSFSGAEDTHSYFSPLKGNSAQGGSFPSQNGSSSKSKDIEILESRPNKVRRKMFDLHLPAEEYIDTEEGEQFGNKKANKNHDIFLGDASRSDSSLRSTNGLADLNEPALAEETHAPTYADLLSTSSHRENRDHEVSAKPNSLSVDVAKEILVSSHVGSSNGTFGNLYVNNNGNGRVWLPNVSETGQSTSILKSASQGFHPGKLSLSSQPVQTLLNKARKPPNSPTDQTKIDLCQERASFCLGTSGTTRNANHPDSFIASRTPILQFAPPSPGLTKSWSQSASFWEKSNLSVTRMSMPVQSHPSLNSTSLNHRIFGDAQHFTSNNSGANLSFGQNGFYHGSSSGSKESQAPRSSLSHDYLNCNIGNGVPDLFATHGSSKYFNSLNFVKSAKGMDLNVTLSTSSSNEAASLHGDWFVDGERSRKDHFAGSPWLRPKTGNKNEATNSGRDLNNRESSLFHSATNQPSGRSNDVVKKILGFSISDKPHASEKERSLRLLDINLPCDADCHDSSIEKTTSEKFSVSRCLIDLNSCLSEDEAPPASFCPSTSSKLKTTTILIDLEAPAAPETEEAIENQKLKAETDELAKIAAESIVSISSIISKTHPVVTTAPNPLNWFADIASSYENDMDRTLKRSNDSSSSEMEKVDFFERMTLKLTETKPEDYTPTPPVTETPQPEDALDNGTPSRPRRGQARRGRQRRDFQRDILPGIVSLSRHEVTEDLQTFGGIMRATGHSWNSLARGRGRRRAAVSAVSVCTMQVNNGEEMSLTGWGKTIRRPRRQRCAAGNVQSLLLS